MESAEHNLVATMAGKRPTPIVRDAHTLLLRGIDALERDHVDNAVGLLQQSVELDPDSSFGWLALGIALTKALEIPAAETALQHAIRLEPRNFWRAFPHGGTLSAGWRNAAG